MAAEAKSPGRIRGRLAPSPTGALHVGNARTFLVAWLAARTQGGSLVFRMEDLDHPKVKRGAAREAMGDLKWLGLDWDEGPDRGGAHEPYVQSERIAWYRRGLEQLLAAGLAYPCVCSRRDVEEAQGAPHEWGAGLRYPGTCRGRFSGWEEAVSVLPSGRLPAWRFSVRPGEVRFVDGFHGEQRTDVARDVGDFAIARHRHGAGYMLAVVLDDDAMAINEVVRGDDLLSATSCQQLIYEALDLSPPAYFHVPLVVGPDGRRLAKRHGDTRIKTLREAGIPAERVLGMLAAWSGWVKPGVDVTVQDLLALYRPRSIPTDPVVFGAEAWQSLGVEEPETDAGADRR